MRSVQVSEDTFRKLVKLKNHWSFQNNRITNPQVLKVLDELKGKIFGYDSNAPAEEIERISNKKSRDQLEDEMEQFSRVLDDLLVSGYDFDPGYTLDEHIRKMIDEVEER
jgi:hypothetical protein